MAKRGYRILSEAAFIAALRQRSMRATAQRLAVHRAMCQLEHASADIVYEAVKKNYPEVKISTASVYNILTELSDKGIYSHRLSSTGKMTFDAIRTPHLHIYDMVLDEFVNVEDEALMQIIEEHFAGRRFRGYNIDHIDINIVSRPTKYKLKKKK
ncbi:MAG: transcriptional repressor [Bacteroidales bacterium]|nr:transcriptional repressor [Bacteroidales bacterium]